VASLDTRALGKGGPPALKRRDIIEVEKVVKDMAFKLPFLTDNQRSILHCCVYDLADMADHGYAFFQVDWIHSYFDKKHNPEKRISLREIVAALYYLQSVDLVSDMPPQRDLPDEKHLAHYRFIITPFGWNFFELEKDWKKKDRRRSIWYPMIVAAITSVLTFAVVRIIESLLPQL